MQASGLRGRDEDTHTFIQIRTHAARKTQDTQDKFKKKGGGGRREESLSCMRIVSRRAGAKDYRAKDFCLASLPMRDAKHAYTT